MVRIHDCKDGSGRYPECIRFNLVCGQFQHRATNTQGEIASKAANRKWGFSISARDDLLSWLQRMTKVGEPLGLNSQRFVMGIHMTFAGNPLDLCVATLGLLAERYLHSRKVVSELSVSDWFAVYDAPVRQIVGDT